MPLPPYTWDPQVSVVDLGGGMLEASWNHIVIDNPIAPTFGEVDTFEQVLSTPYARFNPGLNDGILGGTTPEAVPMPPPDTHQAEWPGATGSSICRWVGLGLFCYQIYVDGILTARTTLSEIDGLVETATEVYAGGTDSLGHVIRTLHSYAMTPYVKPDNTITVPGSPTSEVFVAALYEEVPPFAVWDFSTNRCIHYPYDVHWDGHQWICTLLSETAQESVVPGVTEANFSWPNDYPAGAVNDYLFYRPDCLGAQMTCPATFGTCQVQTICPQPLLGIYEGTTAIHVNYGIRDLIPGGGGIAGPATLYLSRAISPEAADGAWTPPVADGVTNLRGVSADANGDGSGSAGVGDGGVQLGGVRVKIP